MAYPAPQHDELIGRTIDGRYEILARIGEGGMGVVYKARQTSIDRTVAVKMLNPQMAQDPTWVQRFNNEAKACSRLQHPNTIRMFDFGQTREGRLFMAMEFLDGETLRQAIAAGAPMASVRVLKILIQCCASLAEAHNIGIIHRDIKPDNVFLLNLAGSPDFVKLLDFSVAKLLQGNDGMRTQAGVVFGTPQYMSPEQGRGAPLTPGSDLYALGILAYEMLTGTVPFSDDNPMTVLQMHLRATPAPLPHSVPQPMQQVVMRALEKDPQRRYQTSTEMMQHCQQVFAQLGAQGGGMAPSPRGAPVGGEPTMVPGNMRQVMGPPPGMGAPPPAVGGPPPGFGPPPAGPPIGGEATMVPGQMRQVMGGPPPAVGGPPPAVGGPPPAMGGPPPAAGAGGPPPMMGGPAGADQKTMIAGDASKILAAAGIRPGGYSSPSPGPQAPYSGNVQPNSMKTMIADGASFGGSAAGSGASGVGAPPMPQAPQPQHTPPPMVPASDGAPNKTMMLNDTEGILSLGGRSAPAQQPTALAGNQGPSATFWAVCLISGLSIGILAYLAVLKLGS